MSDSTETPEKSLPPPWDRIFSLATRAFVWILLIAILWVLRPFMLLIFLTFVFAYIQAHGVDGLQHRIKNRAIRVTFVGLVFLGTLAATGFTLFPQVKEQAETAWENRHKYANDADRELVKFLKKYPSAYDSLLKRSAALKEIGDASSGPGTPGEHAARTPPGGGNDEKDKPQAPELHPIRDVLANVQNDLADNALAFGQSVLGYASSFLLSLLFSFLIVLDLPKLQRSIQGLSRTKIGFIYDEVADNIAGFGRVLGRALEAQLFIAACNTILTAIGVWMMGLPNLLVLSTIVFFCSFIPVVGTFISSTPICLLALQSDGVGAMVLAIVLICAIHALETYVLNPQIYGHHMHMNPVLVLIVLTIGGKLFGVWGLVLGIPIVNYFFRHAIRYRAERPAET
ncbi:MAG: AI-2E family transporter [Planctomycetes bacterium]|nr:AI-2E family transporter [Planctomycetota bacterium]